MTWNVRWKWHCRSKVEETLTIEDTAATTAIEAKELALRILGPVTITGVDVKRTRTLWDLMLEVDDD